MKQERDNRSKQHYTDSYTRLISLARASHPESKEESAPPFFAARVVACAMTESRRLTEVVALSPWDLIGWRALAAAMAVACLALFLTDTDLVQLAASTNGITLSEDTAALEISALSTDIL